MTAPVDPAALRAMLERVTSGSAYLRDKLDAAGVRPADIAEPEDLAKLPFTTKAELRETPVLDYAAVPAERVVRVHASTGTTGRRTICAYTARDVEDWTEMVARCLRYAGVTPHDRVQVAVGYGLWAAGTGFQSGIERLGAMVVPAGPGDTEPQLDLLRELDSTVLWATSSPCCSPSWSPGATCAPSCRCGSRSPARNGGARPPARGSSRCSACGRSTCTG